MNTITALSKEQLLKLRFEVIADYPYATWKIGDILHNAEFDPIFYPGIFKPLEWWEKRDWSDFPQYIKMRDGKVKKVLPVECDNQTFHQPDTIELRFLKIGYMMYGSQPATEAEYTEYLKTTAK